MLFQPIPDSVTYREREAESLTSTFPTDNYHAWISVNELASDVDATEATLTLDFTTLPGESLAAAALRAVESLADELRPHVKKARSK